MKRMNSISHILFYRQPTVIDGVSTTCYSLAQIGCALFAFVSAIVTLSILVLFITL
jgi:hypothetical protein